MATSEQKLKRQILKCNITSKKEKIIILSDMESKLNGIKLWSSECSSSLADALKYTDWNEKPRSTEKPDRVNIRTRSLAISQW
jgi:hypothetical protein